MTSLSHKIGALGAPAKLALGALATTVVGGSTYFLSTYEVHPLPAVYASAYLLPCSCYSNRTAAPSGAVSGHSATGFAPLHTDSLSLCSYNLIMTDCRHARGVSGAGRQ